MKLPKYLYTIGKEKDSCLLVSTDPPYYVAQIFRFKHEDAFAKFIANCKGRFTVAKDYMFVFVLLGTMGKRYGNVYADGYYLKCMAEWFYQEVIRQNYNAYRRYERKEVQT